MKVVIEIPDDELKETLKLQVARAYNIEFGSDRNLVKRIVAEQVREIIYKDKALIIDRIVDQASRECKNKALKKIIESIGE